MTDSSPISSIPDDPEIFHARYLVERYAASVTDQKDKRPKVLFAFLDHSPQDSQQVIAEDIIKCPNLSQLADHYTSAILYPFRAKGGKTPATVSHFDTPDVSDVANELTSQRRNHTKLKSECLARDGNRCVLTGYYDSNMARLEQQNVKAVNTQAAHIVPFSLATFTERERCAKGTIWGALRHTFPSIADFRDEEINSTHNALNLWSALHEEFGKFNICLEPTETENRYRIKTYWSYSALLSDLLPSDGFVTLTAHDSRYPLPDGCLLALHASIGAILHASGMSEVIEHMLDKRDEIPYLASDGSTSIETLFLAFPRVQSKLHSVVFSD